MRLDDLRRRSIGAVRSRLPGASSGGGTGGDRGRPTLKRFTYAEIDDALLRYYRWCDRQRAGVREEDLPSLEPVEDGDLDAGRAADEYGVVVLAPLRPVDEELLAYLGSCPEEEWEEYFAYNQNEQDVLHAREDPDAFMEYVFRDKDGRPWRQEGFHSEWQRLLPTPDEAVRLSNGEVVPALDREGRPILDDSGRPLDKSLLTAIIAPREHAKTTQLSVGRTIYELGRNIRLRAKVVTATPPLARAVLFDVAQNIELNPRVQRVFPNLVPDYEAGWSKTQLYLQRPADAGKDPSFEAMSVLGSGAGSRSDWTMFDDVVDFRNAVANPGLRTQVARAIKSVFIPLMPPDGRAVYSSTPWHESDYTAEVEKTEGWTVWKRSAIRTRKNAVGLTVKEVLWPGKWHLTALRIREGQIGDREFARQFLLRTIAEGERTFPESALQASMDPSRHDISPIHVLRDFVRVAGLDLASSLSKKTGAFNVLFTFALETVSSRMIPVEMYREQVQFTELVDAFVERIPTHRWELVVVENNAYQQAMVSALEEKRDLVENMPLIEGFRTGTNKADPEVGLPGLALVFANRGVSIPVPAEQHVSDCECPLCIWLAELRGHPTASRLSDTVMATWFAYRAVLSLGVKQSTEYRVTRADEVEEDEGIAPSIMTAEEARRLYPGLVLTGLASDRDQDERRRSIEREMWRAAGRQVSDDL